ncbi:LIC_13387 family protein [Streptomyces gobitricini]|uniref:LIC_13387 family protein n=1 Tax=Streptomyces gobitricini TaxID=68211 RepID=UPI0031DD77D8
MRADTRTGAEAGSGPGAGAGRGPEARAGAAAHRSTTAFRTGAWAWVLTGAGHLALAAVMALRPEDPAGARATAAMRAYVVEIAGVRRSLYDIDLGMSWAMGTALIFGGVVCLLVARSAPALVTRSRSLSGLGLAASLVILGLSLFLLPAPPIVLFAVASVAFGGALATARPVPPPAER